MVLVINTAPGGSMGGMALSIASPLPPLRAHPPGGPGVRFSRATRRGHTRSSSHSEQFHRKLS